MAQFSSLILFLLAIAFLLRVDFIFYIIYLIVGIYGWSRWYAPRALRKIAVVRQYSDHAYWGERVPVTIELTNRNWLPLAWLQLNETIAIKLATNGSLSQVVTLKGRETKGIQYEVKARRRGYYQLGPMRLTAGDLFGLAGEHQSELAANYLTVYPRITQLEQLGLPSRLPFGTLASQQRLYQDPSRPNGVREFRSGDSLRQINWKVSAHSQQLLVKTLEPSKSLETSILFNLHSHDYQRANRASTVEWAVEVAASLAAHLSNQRQSVGLITNGVDPLAIAGGRSAEFDEISGRLLAPDETSGSVPPAIPPRTGRSHLMKILERLARIEIGDLVPFQPWATSACGHLSWGVTILIITPHGDESVCQAVHQLVRAGFNPVLVTIEPDYNFDRVRERARSLGFTTFNVPQKQDLEQWAQSSLEGTR